MARALIELVIAVGFITSVLSLTQSSPSTSLLLYEGPRPAMLLPLFHTPPNTTSRSSSNSRRLLQRSNARMRLYDDLLHGYYTTLLWIGTPPQRFALIVDTGSSVTYVPCSTCEDCGRHQDPKFQPDLSSTYQPVKCSLDCNCNSESGQCVYERQYAEMSTSSGVLGEDLISFGDLSELEPQRAVFGCENMETGDLYSQRADGIMGLGSGDLSIMDQLVDKGVINDSFSLCYGGMGVGGGAMVLGGISPPTDMVFAHSNPVRSPYYNIDLKEIHVAGKPLPLNPNVFDGKHGTVMDSGTTYAYLPEAAFVAFKDAIMKELHSFQKIRGPDPNYNDICFSGAGSDVSELSKTFPAVDMVFSNGQKLSLSPENYLFRHSKVNGAYCLGIFHNGNDPTTLLGGIIVRNTLVMYDRQHSKIGFWKTNCSELWERLHISGETPNRENSTAKIPPTLAPAEAPLYGLPRELPIGKITFNLLVNISYSNLQPHITELAKFIADDLDINPSQVHLLNFTPIGNDSLIRWAIFPPGSSHYISNATAASIIARFAEHRVRLPGTFGSYQLVGWNIEPLAERFWNVVYLETQTTKAQSLQACQCSCSRARTAANIDNLGAVFAW
ncbi:aspartic proteinase 36-like isoform X2 [Corylus avellana]|uniref:aspartic proteinase 36-like isoform X2 n=1 Tax=Corylus avellana TaxID=13451 RepID=UPI00286A4F56|nr:aspartic proteinase 36-like isoform X2 [Corylus avellana]